jgi:glycine betaine/choline ABC-type transport system substrate-binding protein
MAATEAQVFEAFSNEYRRRNGSLKGVQGAYEFWKDPGIKCAILETGRGKPKCNAPCQFCLDRRSKELAP